MTHFVPVAPQPLVAQTRLVQARLPQQSALLVQVAPGPMQAVRQRVGLGAMAPQTGADSQQPPAPKPEVHD